MNQRAKDIERVTLTLPDELLEKIEAEAAPRGLDRLAWMREALRTHLTPKAEARHSQTWRGFTKAHPRGPGKLRRK